MTGPRDNENKCCHAPTCIKHVHTHSRTHKIHPPPSITKKIDALTKHLNTPKSYIQPPPRPSTPPPPTPHKHTCTPLAAHTYECVHSRIGAHALLPCSRLGPKGTKPGPYRTPPHHGFDTFVKILKEDIEEVGRGKGGCLTPIPPPYIPIDSGSDLRSGPWNPQPALRPSPESGL